jgi:hypothetical protein
MTFNDVINLKNYYTLSEATAHRKYLWERVEPLIDNLRQDLFDIYDIDESIFIINSFFDKQLYETSSVELVIDVDKTSLEQMVEDGFFQKHESDDIALYVRCIEENRFYIFNGSFLKETEISIDIKERL